MDIIVIGIDVRWDSAFQIYAEFCNESKSWHSEQIEVNEIAAINV